MALRFHHPICFAASPKFEPTKLETPFLYFIQFKTL